MKKIYEERKILNMRIDPKLYKALRFAAVERDTTMLNIVIEAVSKEIGYKPEEKEEKGVDE